MSNRPLHICIVYDRIYPASIGGAERWYRLLAERLAREGHQVTYLTTRHWPPGDEPDIPGVTRLARTRAHGLYRRGRRRHLPVLRFGLAVLWHLLVHGRRYDVVQTSAMLSWAAVAVVLCAPLHRYRAVLDWWEVWTFRYWRSYLGVAGGIAGRVVQRALARSGHQPIAYSALHRGRLERLRGSTDVAIVRGLLSGGAIPTSPELSEEYAISLGRLIPEKDVAELLPALAVVRTTLPRFHAIIIGDGPEKARIARAIEDLELTGSVALPGFAPEEFVQDALGRATCLVLLSRREGYGLVVAEAAALGVPSVVLAHPDSAAPEIIVDGVNGVLCESAAASDVASAILRVHDAGYELRLQTMAWYRRRANELTIEGSLPRLMAIYRGDECAWRTTGLANEQAPR